MADPAQDNTNAGKLSADLRAAQHELHVEQRARVMALASIDRMKASRSWRITRSLRTLTRLLTASSLTERELIPESSLEPLRPGHWRATSPTPTFLLPCVPIRGYIRVQAVIRAAEVSEAHLYFDSGGTFNAAERLALGRVGPDGTKIDVIHHLPTDVHCFRLDPVRAAGDFELTSFRITPLSGLAVDARSLKARIRRARAGGPLRTSIVNLARMLLRGDFKSIRPKFRAVLGGGAEAGADYQRWRAARALDDTSRAALRAQAAAMPRPPLISVLVPTYNTRETLLREMIDSVIRQTYPHWELCIADDASTAPHVARVLAEYAERDPRVRFTVREDNGHISAASNTALAMARGDFVALLDHDDTLAEHALSAVAREINARPEVEMFYSDEDKLTLDGRHLDPFFKPDWSPEYFLACMYTCHLGVYRTSRVRELGGFRTTYDMAQDYDLVLRLTRTLTSDQICHIPDILYHWRMTPESTASGASAKPLAHTRAQAAIRESLAAAGTPATVTDGPAAGFHRVRYAIVGNPKVTVVIPSACRPRSFPDGQGGTFTDFWARRCAASMRNRATYTHLQIVVVGPEEIPAALARELAALDVIRATYATPFNFSQACNTGAAAGDGEHVLFLNDDTEVVTPDFIEEMLSFSQLPGVGAVGARLLFPDGTLQHAGVTVLRGNPGHAFYRADGSSGGYYFSARVHRNWSAVTAACLMMRREIFEAVGGFDEAFPLNYNDVDLCLRIREQGHRIVYTPYAELLHHESVTKPGTFEHEQKMFRDRWQTRLPHDPYYNPNLSEIFGDFRVAP